MAHLLHIRVYHVTLEEALSSCLVANGGIGPQAVGQVFPVVALQTGHKGVIKAMLQCSCDLCNTLSGEEGGEGRRGKEGEEGGEGGLGRRGRIGEEREGHIHHIHLESFPPPKKKIPFIFFRKHSTGLMVSTMWWGGALETMYLSLENSLVTRSMTTPARCSLQKKDVEVAGGSGRCTKC